MNKRNPFKCNYCGSPLMLYQIFISEALVEQLRAVCKVSSVEVFKVQKCKKCGRTYIWAEPLEAKDETQGENKV